MKFLNKLFDKKSKIKVEDKPYEFISNPPAAELTLKRKQQLDIQQAESDKLEKQKKHVAFIMAISNTELKIDKEIRDAINRGSNSTTIYTQDYSWTKIGGLNEYSETVVNYLAARKFRARGFKVRTITKSRPLLYINWSTPIGEATKPEHYQYYKKIEISWE